jgi:hypothetical protein
MNIILHQLMLSVNVLIIQEVTKDRNKWVDLLQYHYLSLLNTPGHTKTNYFFYNCYTNLFDLSKVIDQEENVALQNSKVK